MTIRTLVVDDERHARDRMLQLLAAEPDIDPLPECATGPAAVEAIRALRPDLVFLDIELRRMSGFDVIREVGPAAMPEVVFVTGYDRYAVRAFEVSALDYVLKPYDAARFHDAVARARRRLAERRADASAARLESMLDALDRRIAPRHAGDDAAPASPEPLAWLLVRDARRAVRVVAADDVDWIEAAGNYVGLHVAGARLLYRSSLGDLLARLDPRQFARVHRSAAVNVRRIERLEPYVAGDYIVILKSRERVRLSRTHRQRLEETLGPIR